MTLHMEGWKMLTFLLLSIEEIADFAEGQNGNYLLLCTFLSDSNPAAVPITMFMAIFGLIMWKNAPKLWKKTMGSDVTSHRWQRALITSSPISTMHQVATQVSRPALACQDMARKPPPAEAAL